MIPECLVLLVLLTSSTGGCRSKAGPEAGSGSPEGSLPSPISTSSGQKPREPRAQDEDYVDEDEVPTCQHIFSGASSRDWEPLDVPVHPCDRPCLSGEQPKECHYELELEHYTTMGKACYRCPKNPIDCLRPHCIPGDGFEKSTIAINRMMPGPAIAVCQHDRLIVDVLNGFVSETTSMHFHGEFMKGNQYMDGVPGVTQCPISPKTKFRYRFNATVAGTMFYHSHTAFQRGDGSLGAYIVRRPPDLDPHAHLYDEDLTEHVIAIQEWFYQDTRSAFMKHHWDDGKNKADNLLVNGRGRMFPDSPAAAAGAGVRSRTPLATFSVEHGKRYRFRLYSAAITLCPVQVSVDGHELTLIASDTGDLEPVAGVRSIVVSPGERYDFVLTANQRPKSVYLMRFGGLFDCANLKARAVALLIYDDAMIPEDAALMKLDPEKHSTAFEFFVSDKLTPVVNPLNYAPYLAQDFKPGHIPVTDLKCVRNSSCLQITDEAALKKERPDKVFYLAYDLMDKTNPNYFHKEYYPFEKAVGGHRLRSAQINNITLMFGSTPMLTKDFNRSLICDEESLKAAGLDCDEDWCECVHVIKVDLGDVVELVLIDQGFAYDVSHPFHLHGQAFYVVAMERHVKFPDHIGAKGKEGNSILRSVVEELDKSGQIKRNLVDPPLKDTVTVPDGGFTVLRFLADNPGYWLLHCHMSWHNKIGMGLIIQTGNVETDVGPPPPGFPKCGDFLT